MRWVSSRDHSGLLLADVDDLRRPLEQVEVAQFVQAQKVMNSFRLPTQGAVGTDRAKECRGR